MKANEINMRNIPNETYVFDAFGINELETALDNTTFFSEITKNINLKTFLREKTLS